jgi:hypothetical protein
MAIQVCVSIAVVMSVDYLKKNGVAGKAFLFVVLIEFVQSDKPNECIGVNLISIAVF